MEVSMIEAAGICLGFETKQKEATVEFVSRKDVFILLLTSYGKSVYYATIPFIHVFDQLRGNIGNVVVVVSPLIALVKDEVESFKEQRIGSCIFSVGCWICLLMELPSLLGGADAF